MKIPFVQFLMPDGRQRSVEIDRPEPIATLAKGLIDQGCKFEIEMLQTGQISMEIVRGGKVITGEICANGPEVPKRVDKMIQDAVVAL